MTRVQQPLGGQTPKSREGNCLAQMFGKRLLHVPNSALDKQLDFVTTDLHPKVLIINDQPSQPSKGSLVYFLFTAIYN